MEKKTQVILVN